MAICSVDGETNIFMQDILRSEYVSETVIAIAHRLDSILDFDLVIVMKDGKVAECGSPRTLLMQPSEFRNLWDGSHMERNSSSEKI